MLKGKVALITGSTRGIGWATAQVFAAHGATVILHGRAEGALLEERLQALNAAGGAHRAQPFDVGSPAEIKTAFRSIFSLYKRLDILVNNAGVLEDALVGMYSEETIDYSFRVNAQAPLHCIQGAVRLMERAGGGSIINITSIIGTNGNAGQLLYSSTKAALIGLTRSAAKELAAKNIRVNAVAPGFIDTDMAAGVDVPKTSPFQVVERTLNGVEEGLPEVLADDTSAFVKNSLPKHIETFYPKVAAPRP